ncbi:ArsR/SmtB family transcription factor [Nocardia crassostreae]|uniref:ArsR/SmtB family transcription factor n=1 Tax=Nocardia crassostreae TaxID=53428 RepID=UPI00082CF1A9|nr:helix-turn-helix domain-containing protein [Nocardia crassostreae]
MALNHPAREQIRLEHVLSALGSPVRLGAVRILARGGERNCSSVLNELEVSAKSTMTHHWRVLREAGVIRQTPSGREFLIELRRDDLDARYPGLLDAVLAGARTEAGAPPIAAS